MPKGLKTSPEDVEFMIQQRSQGKTVKEVADMVGCSTMTVSRLTSKDPRCSRGKGGVISRKIQIVPDRDAIREMEEKENAWKYSCIPVEHIINLIGISSNTTYTLNIGSNIAEIQFDRCNPVRIQFNKLEGLVGELMYVANQVKPFIKKG